MYFGTDTVIGICGAAWGDEGKGKFTDEFAAEADLVVRAQGGCNAGHTVVIGDMKIKLHHVPSGIAHPGTINVIGNGVVVDPRVLVDQELKQLAAQGIDTSGLRISSDAHLIMPWHRILDRAREWSLGKGKIGTTARGIGPAYGDKAQRAGIRVGELFDRERLRDRVCMLAEEKQRILHEVYRVPREQFEEWMQAPDQLCGAWLHDGAFDADAITASYLEWAERLRTAVVDSRALLHVALKGGRKVLLEGAQGLLLDIDHGTYPYVTSSNCSAGGFATGAGVPPHAIDRVYNVVSAYMTRVGSGPFPTELGTEEEIAAEHGDDRMSRSEIEALAHTAEDAYSLGKVIRHTAGEFGTTTGRPRRTGWFDAVACRLAVQLNGPDVILSKLDVLDVMPRLRICTAYKYDGPAQWYCGRTLEQGAVLTEFPTDARVLQYCAPTNFEEYPGWLTDISAMKSYDDLPAPTQAYLDGIANQTGCHLRLISVGPRRSQTIAVP
jgi:adenylosuccinate synthase